MDFGITQIVAGIILFIFTSVITYIIKSKKEERVRLEKKILETEGKLNESRKEFEKRLDFLRAETHSKYESILKYYHDLSVSLPKDYVTKVDLNQFRDSINHRFDRLEEKLDEWRKQ